jgi:hypothetical protein
MNQMLRRRGRIWSGWALCALWLLQSASAAAVTRAGVDLPRYLQTERGLLELAVCGVRDTFWIDHYVTAVYVPRGESVLVVRDPQYAKAIRLHVIESRFLPPEIPDKWRRALAGALDGKAMAKVNSAYRSLVDGDVITIVYTPTRGIVFSLNGRTVVRGRGHGVINAVLQEWAEGESVSGKLEKLRDRYACRDDQG